MMKKTVLKLSQIVKEFPGVRALDKVDFDLIEGEVHALIGENGSGKSTLMNIISGVMSANQGEIELYNQTVRFKDPKDAQDNGISMIHQELSLAPELSVVENIFIGRQLKNRLGFISHKEMRLECEKLLEEYNIEDVKYNDLVKDLSLSQMQLIEIAKAIYLDNKIIIMDEPTSSLTKAETATLFKHIENLKQKGCSIIFISHRLDEIKKIADRITVLRDGNRIITAANDAIEVKDIIAYMVGKDFKNALKRENKSQSEKVLEVKNITNKKIQNVSFHLKRGEVLGITGLVGSGRTELLQTIFGEMNSDSGEIYLYGKKQNIKSVATAISLGIGLIPEGRKTQGLFPGLSVQENISIVKRQHTSRFGFLNEHTISSNAAEMRDKLNIKTPTLKNKINNLSGGNQQKAIIGRWLMNHPKILLLDEPTHGIDVGAKAEIYGIIDQLSKQGISVILVSSELPEILSLCDRIIVMHRGRINGELDNKELTQEMIMTYATNQN